ncbi:rCG24969 [Rattus norvegicus]|uniref:RCG24969 n=1 Tax=Rattus norvegicus TaxID=10116 RepID=A6KUR2_RAT|nr:rCG24969 [Rattus norvegicus]
MCLNLPRGGSLLDSKANRTVDGHQWDHLHPGLTQGDLVCRC